MAHCANMLIRSYRRYAFYT